MQWLCFSVIFPIFQVLRAVSWTESDKVFVKQSISRTKSTNTNTGLGGKILRQNRCQRPERPPASATPPADFTQKGGARSLMREQPPPIQDGGGAIQAKGPGSPQRIQCSGEGCSGLAPSSRYVDRSQGAVEATPASEWPPTLPCPSDCSTLHCKCLCARFSFWTAKTLILLLQILRINTKTGFLLRF